MTCSTRPPRLVATLAAVVPWVTKDDVKAYVTRDELAVQLTDLGNLLDSKAASRETVIVKGMEGLAAEVKAGREEVKEGRAETRMDFILMGVGMAAIMVLVSPIGQKLFGLD